MTKQTNRLRAVGLAALGLCLLALALLAAPPIARRLPDRLQAQIPDPLWALVETPLPTALPAAQVTAAPILPDIFASPTPPPTETATAVALPPTFTPLPQATPTVPPTAAPTFTPTPSPTATPTPTPTPTAPPQARISGLRIIAQTFNNCGPANLTMVLNYYGRPDSQADVGGLLKPMNMDANVSPWELAAYVNQETPLEANYFAGGDLGLLKRLIAAGFPVIVEKGYWPSDRLGWMGHYLTLIGYDDGRQTFTALDSYLGPWDSAGMAIGYDDLLTYWRHFNYTFLLVYPPAERERAEAILGPTMLDREMMWRQAGQRAQTAVAAEPDDAFAWFNLGTNLTRLGQITGDSRYFENGAAAYDQARQLGLPWRMLWYQFDIYEAYLAVGRYEEAITLANVTVSGAGDRIIEESFLYRGRAYLALGNAAQARLDYREALRLNPNFTAAQEALAALSDS